MSALEYFWVQDNCSSALNLPFKSLDFTKPGVTAMKLVFLAFLAPNLKVGSSKAQVRKTSVAH
jgi:hypothetical protein